MSTVTGLFRRSHQRFDLIYGGPGQIVDTVDIEGTPAARRVRLVDRRTGALLKETWSDPVTGQYRFDHLALNREFIVYALDYEAIYNAVIADRITAEPMP